MLTFVTLVNDGELLARCRASAEGSKELKHWIVVEPHLHGWNAAQGLNHGLEEADTPWVALAHQDIVFPKGWTTTVARQLERLPESVAMVGLSGTRADGRYRGHILDPNGHCYWGPLPAEVLTLDEVVLIVRRSTGLRFDERIPGFHCYGADMCLQAAEKGLRVMVIDAALKHLSSGVVDEAYDLAAQWLLDRWGPTYGYILPTPTALLEDSARASAFRRLLFRWRRRLDRRKRNRVPRDVLVQF